ncbi:hypothetical protein BH10PLA2_BH10PLA2_00790 [soil metagenome]
MAKLSILAGATSQSINVFIQDSSATTGVGLTGLAFNTASLVAYYTFAGANATATAITLATLAAVNSAFSSGGFKEIDATNMPGVYRLDIPNAALATSKGRSVVVMLKGATNMAPCVAEIELTGWDNQDAVHGGLSCLPNTACTTNASLLTSGTGTDQLSVASGRTDLGKILGTAVSSPATAGILDVNVKNMNNVAATSITTISANQGTTQPINFTGTGASALAKSDMVDIAGAAVSTSAAQIGVNAVNIGGTAQTGRDIGANVLLSSAYDFAKGTVAMTEAYPTKNSTATPAQALYAIMQSLFESAVSSTTLTVKKRDQSTTAKTCTLNDATNPTAITEAS